MRRVPPKSTIEDIPQPTIPAPNAFKSPAPSMVVETRCIGVGRMDRRTLNRFTRDIWARFDERDLGALKLAILHRRRVLPCPMRP